MALLLQSPGLPGRGSQLCHLRAVPIWAIFLTSLKTQAFLLCNRRLLHRIVSRNKWSHEYKAFSLAYADYYRYYSRTFSLWLQYYLSHSLSSSHLERLGDPCALASVLPSPIAIIFGVVVSTLYCRCLCPWLGFLPPCVLFDGRAWVWLILYHFGIRDTQEMFVEWMNIILNGTAAWTWAPH